MSRVILSARFPVFMFSHVPLLLCRALGDQVGKFQESKADLTAARELDPEGKAITKAFKKLAKKVADDKAKKKKKFGGMFKKMKGGMYDNKPNLPGDPTKDPANKRVRCA